MRAIGVAWLLLGLAACTTQPLEKRSKDELGALWRAGPASCRPEYTAAGWRVLKPEICQRELPEWRAAIARAYLQVHAEELASAPPCLQNIAIPSEFASLFGIDPAAADVTAQMLARGVFVSSVNQSPAACRLAVCAWRKQMHDEGSEYCL